MQSLKSTFSKIQFSNSVSSKLQPYNLTPLKSQSIKDAFLLEILLKLVFLKLPPFINTLSKSKPLKLIFSKFALFREIPSKMQYSTNSFSLFLSFSIMIVSSSLFKIPFSSP